MECSSERWATLALVADEAARARVGKTFLRFAARNPSPLYEFGLAETRRKSNPATGLAKTVWVTTNVDHDSVFAAKVGGETYYIKIEHPGLLTPGDAVGAGHTRLHRPVRRKRTTSRLKKSWPTS
jgi:hypothetical protein